MKKQEVIVRDLRLSEKRLQHTLGVVRACVMLCERHFPEVDPEDAETAALMHDFTKEYPYEKQMELVRRYGIELTESEKEEPKLLHARTAAALAKEAYGLPENVVNAIRWHTTGKPGMSPLEEALYFADYIEDTRTFPGCVRLREYYEREYRARKDKRKALLLGLERSFEITIRDRMSERKSIDPYTVEARNYYLGLLK